MERILHVSSASWRFVMDASWVLGVSAGMAPSGTTALARANALPVAAPQADRLARGGESFG
jgi:hypothetical protein